MAREVAVDVASHSPQVDPILAELAEALADLTPMAPQVPYLLGDPVTTRARGRPATPAIGWTTCGSTVRFAAAVQAALEDGYRVFAELSPHPLLTRAVEQTAQSTGHPGRRAGQHAARAAAAARAARLLSRICTAPAPRWTSRCCIPAGGWSMRRCRRGPTGGCSSSPTAGASRHRAPAPSRCIRCWARTCGCPRSPSGTPGRATSAPRRCHGWPTTRSTTWPRFPGPPTARWRWPPPAPCSARSPRSATSASSRCCCSTTQTPVTAVASVDAPGVVEFAVADRPRTANASGGPPRSCTPVDDEASRRARDIAALLAAHPSRIDGDELRQPFDERGVQFGPAFTGLTAAHTAERRRHACWPKSRLPGPHPRPAGRLRHPPGAARRLLPVGRGAPRHAGRPATAGCCCRWACAGCAATARRATPATAYVRVTGRRDGRVSRPTSTCSTSTGRCC